MMEDVDALQLELEAMLAATVVKKRTVAHEVKLIEDMERKGGASSSSSKSGGKRGAAASGPGSPAKRGANNGSSSSASASDRAGQNKDGAKRFRNAAGKPVDSGKVSLVNQSSTSE